MPQKDPSKQRITFSSAQLRKELDRAVNRVTNLVSDVRTRSNEVHVLLDRLSAKHARIGFWVKFTAVLLLLKIGAFFFHLFWMH